MIAWDLCSLLQRTMMQRLATNQLSNLDIASILQSFGNTMRHKEPTHPRISLKHRDFLHVQLHHLFHDDTPLSQDYVNMHTHTLDLNDASCGANDIMSPSCSANEIM